MLTKAAFIEYNNNSNIIKNLYCLKKNVTFWMYLKYPYDD